MGPSNEPQIYDLSGDTFFDVSSETSIFGLYVENQNSVKNTINNYESDLSAYLLSGQYYNTDTSTIDTGGGCKFNVPQISSNSIAFFENCEENRFYTLNSHLFINDSSYTTLVNDLTSGNEIKQNENLVEGIKKICEMLKDEYRQIKDLLTVFFDKQIKDNTFYLNATKWKLPDNTVKTCTYVYPAVGDLDAKTKKIKDLYSNNNLNDDKKTFNGKVTLN